MGFVFRGSILARLAGPFPYRLVDSSLVPRQDLLPLSTIPICQGLWLWGSHWGSYREVTWAEGAGIVQIAHPACAETTNVPSSAWEQQIAVPLHYILILCTTHALSLPSGTLCHPP